MIRRNEDYAGRRALGIERDGNRKIGRPKMIWMKIAPPSRKGPFRKIRPLRKRVRIRVRLCCMVMVIVRVRGFLGGLQDPQYLVRGTLWIIVNKMCSINYRPTL